MFEYNSNLGMRKGLIWKWISPKFYKIWIINQASRRCSSYYRRINLPPKYHMNYTQHKTCQLLRNRDACMHAVCTQTRVRGGVYTNVWGGKQAQSAQLYFKRKITLSGWCRPSFGGSSPLPRLLGSCKISLCSLQRSRPICMHSTTRALKHMRT